MNIKNIPINDRPRERLISNGVRNISNEDLISIILRTGTKDKSVKDLALIILNKFGDVRNMRDIELNDILSINGIGKVKAIELIASIELGRRVQRGIFPKVFLYNYCQNQYTLTNVINE